MKGWRNNDVQPPNETEWALLEGHVRDQRPDLVLVVPGFPGSATSAAGSVAISSRSSRFSEPPHATAGHSTRTTHIVALRPLCMAKLPATGYSAGAPSADPDCSRGGAFLT